MTLQKNVKSRVFWIFKKRKKRILELCFWQSYLISTPKCIMPYYLSKALYKQSKITMTRTIT